MPDAKPDSPEINSRYSLVEGVAKGYSIAISVIPAKAGTHVSL